MGEGLLQLSTYRLNVELFAALLSVVGDFLFTLSQGLFKDNRVHLSYRAYTKYFLFEWTLNPKWLLLHQCVTNKSYPNLQSDYYI